MKLPIGFKKDGRFAVEVEVDEPSPKGLAEMQRKGQSGDSYSAILALLGDVVKSITFDDGETVEAPGEMRALLRDIPFRSAETVIIEALKLLSPDDGIDAMYECPRCAHKIVAERGPKGEDGEYEYDTRDHVGDLPIQYAAAGEDSFMVDLAKPITIKDKDGTVLVEASSLTFRHPTLNDCIKAYQRRGVMDPVGFQHGIYAEALVAIDGEVLTAQQKNLYAASVIDGLRSYRDTKAIAEEVMKYGIAQTAAKMCPACGMKWDAEVPTKNFFVSALRSR